MKERKSNIELLRIVATLLILMYHYVYAGHLVFEEFTLNHFIAKIFWFFGELGVNLFILITGYFMCKSKFSVKKLICLVAEVSFYYVILAIIEDVTGINKLDTVKEWAILIFPAIFDVYWFITAYIILYLLTPYLNNFINSMDKQTYTKLLITVLVIWCIIPTFFGLVYNNTEKMLYYTRFLWLIIMYFVGAYIRLYGIKIIDTKKKAVKISIISFLIMILSILVIQSCGAFFEKIGTTDLAYLWRPNNIVMFLLSISVFKIFLDTDIEYNETINKVASTTLGIYMIHTGPMRKFMWLEIFKTYTFTEDKFFVFHIILASLTIFTVGMIVDFIRQFIEKYTLKRFLDSNMFEKICKKCNNVKEKIIDSI